MNIEKKAPDRLIFSNINISKNCDKFSLTFFLDKKKILRTFTTSIPIKHVPLKHVKNIIFHLGLFLLMDYDQQLAPKKIIIKTGKLSQEQKEFYIKVRNLYAGQHLFEKRAPLSILTNDIESSGEKFVCSHEKLNKQKIIASFGGGKESMLFKLLFKQKKIQPLWFIRTREVFKKTLNSIASISDLGEYVSIHDGDDMSQYENTGLEESQYTRTRTVITVYIICMLLFALEKKYGNICLGNEKSASDPYCVWDGEIINHQFDKAADYRKMLNDYLRKYVVSEINLFSIFEGIYEYKIAQMIKRFRAKDFYSMTSCNHCTDKKKWCHKCSKCAWTFAILSFAFGQKEATKIVGKNLFKNVSIYREILNPNFRKPFDCLGERPEVWLILYDCLQAEQKGEVLQFFQKEYLPDFKRYLDIYRERYEKEYPNPALPKILHDIFV